jgi:TolA-binding protein
MSEVKQATPRTENEVAVDRAKDFWSQYSKPLLIGGGVLLALLAGWFGYQKLYKEPAEAKALEAIYPADNFFIQDSLSRALPIAARVADNYGGTKAGNRAKFEAGVAYLKAGDFKNAEKYLGDFESGSKLVQARAYKLLGDAYAGQGKNADALKSYKKAARHFEDDRLNAPEYLYMAAYLAHKVLNDKNEAIDLYKELKKKYQGSGPATEADKHLAELGIYSAE